jgi:hypothetical protein
LAATYALQNLEAVGTVPFLDLGKGRYQESTAAPPEIGAILRSPPSRTWQVNFK